MSGNSSAITTTRTVDPPLAQSAGYRLDANDRQYIDNQIRGCEQQLVSCVLGGVQCTWVLVDGSSGAIAQGDVVCLNASGTGQPTVVKALLSPLSAAGSAFGIAMTAAGAGAPLLVAIDGVVPPSITGLTGSLSNVRVTLGRCVAVASFTAGDYVLGTCDGAGYLNLDPSYAYPATGGGSVPTGTGIPHIVGGAQNAAATLIVDADVSASAAIAASKVVQATGTGFPHVTAGALDGASIKVDTTNAAMVTVPATSGGVVTSSGTALQQPTGVLAGTNFVSIGASPATAGFLRFPSGFSQAYINLGSAASTPALSSDSSGLLTFGDPSSQQKVIWYSTSIQFGDVSGAEIQPLGNFSMRWNASSILVAQPMVGMTAASSPYGRDGVGTQAMADANQTPAAAVYSFGCIKTTGAITANRTLTVPSGAAADATGYQKTFNNTCTNAFGIIVSTGAGTTITIANGKSAILLIDSRGVTRITPDT